MIIREFFETRDDGINLFISYSNLNFKIQNIQSGEIYDNAVDIENSTNQYQETNILVGEEA